MEARLEDDQDEIEELLEKQRAHISHTSSLQTQLNEATIQIGELEEGKATLESRVRTWEWEERASLLRVNRESLFVVHCGWGAGYLRVDGHSELVCCALHVSIHVFLCEN